MVRFYHPLHQISGLNHFGVFLFWGRCLVRKLSGPGTMAVNWK